MEITGNGEVRDTPEEEKSVGQIAGEASDASPILADLTNRLDKKTELYEQKDRPLIFRAIANVMRDCGAIGKEQRNKQQGYNFRGIDDLYNALQDIKAKHGVFEVPEVLEMHMENKKTNSGGNMILRVFKVRYTFYADDGSSVQAVTVGEAMDSGDKSSNKCMAAAHKYALIQIFNIKTDERSDTENNSYSMAPPQQQQRQQGQDPAILQMFQRATAAFTPYNISQEDMLSYINKKLPTDVTKQDLESLSKWLTSRKEEKK